MSPHRAELGRFAGAQQRAGLREIRFHDLRHTFGTLAVRGADSIVELQNWLGHAEVRTTMRYTHYREQPMSLLSRLGQATTRRIEAARRMRAELARTSRLWPYIEAAEALAYSTLTDEEARDQLRPRVAGNEQAVLDAIEWLELQRDEYVGDRAYRLLLAAATDTPVKPIDPAMADHFAAERELGSMPLEQAFERLAELEPRLRELADGAPAGNAELRKRRAELVGIGASSEDPLLSSDLAASIVMQYVRARTRGDVDLSTSYFESPKKAGVHSGNLFGPGRPRAQN